MNHYIFDLDDTLILHRNDINYHWISENKELSHYLDKCKGTKYIYTNGTLEHAELVMDKMNLTDKFHTVYARDTETIRKMKPHILSALDVHRDIMTSDDDKFIFFDDLHENLRTGNLLKWTTVWISPNHELHRDYDYVDRAYPNIVDALKDIQDNGIMD